MVALVEPVEQLEQLAIQDTKCVLFLDIDGVLHSDLPGVDELFCRLPLIEEVLRDFDGVAIVISSTWRFNVSLANIRRRFSPDIQLRVVGMTPVVRPFPCDGVLGGSGGRGHRQREVEAWLTDMKPDGVPWMAIDDREDWFEDDCPNLLITNSLCGFQPDQTQLLRLMLLQRMGEAR